MSIISAGPFGLSCGKLGKTDTMRGRTRHGRATIVRIYTSPVGPPSAAQSWQRECLTQIQTLYNRIPQIVRNIIWPTKTTGLSAYHTTEMWLWRNTNRAIGTYVVPVAFPSTVFVGSLGNSNIFQQILGGTTIRLVWTASLLLPGDKSTDQLSFFMMHVGDPAVCPSESRYYPNAAIRSSGVYNLTQVTAGRTYLMVFWFRQLQPDGTYEYSQVRFKTATP